MAVPGLDPGISPAIPGGFQEIRGSSPRINQHVNDIRHAAREGTSIEISEAPELTAESNAVPSLQLRDLERALAKLPTEQREVILLVGLAYEEVATVLDVPIGTVRSRLSRGRDQLRRLMGVEEASAETDAGSRAA